jgi:hypothetical protein
MFYSLSYHLVNRAKDPMQVNFVPHGRRLQSLDLMVLNCHSNLIRSNNGLTHFYGKHSSTILVIELTTVDPVHLKKGNSKVRSIFSPKYNSFSSKLDFSSNVAQGYTWNRTFYNKSAELWWNVPSDQLQLKTWEMPLLVLRADEIACGHAYYVCLGTMKFHWFTLVRLSKMLYWIEYSLALQY